MNDDDKKKSETIEKEKEAVFRAFFAVDISPYLEMEIAKIIDKLKKNRICRSIKWTKPKNLHITLRFLGNITKDQCLSIIQSIEPILVRIPAFSVQFDELIPFPKSAHPIALVLKPKSSIELISLAMSVDTCVKGYDVKIEKRPFSPHLTLGKIKNKLPSNKLLKALSKVDLPKLMLNIDKVKLIRSELLPEGANYTTLAVFKLQQNLFNH